MFKNVYLFAFIAIYVHLCSFLGYKVLKRSFICGAGQEHTACVAFAPRKLRLRLTQVRFCTIIGAWRHKMAASTLF